MAELFLQTLKIGPTQISRVAKQRTRTATKTATDGRTDRASEQNRVEPTQSNRFTENTSYVS